MSKLRELIAIQKEYDDGSEMRVWLVENSDIIADLIDAAKGVVSFVVTQDDPISIRKVRILADALAKLED